MSGVDEEFRRTTAQQQEEATEEHPFDDLAIGLSSGAITRGQALKLVAAGLFGAFGLASLFPKPAHAAHHRHRHRHHHKRRRRLPFCPVNVKAGCGNTCICPPGTRCNGASVCK